MFVGVIISNIFKGLLRDQIINPPRWWYHSIEEISKAPLNELKTIHLPKNSITYYSIRKRAFIDPHFTKLMEHQGIEFNYELEWMIGFTYINFFFRYNNRANDKEYNSLDTAFMPSNYWESIKILGENQVVTDEICYDHVLDVRFIRNNFEFSNQMVHL